MTNNFYVPYFRPVLDQSGSPRLGRYFIAADDTADFAIGSPVVLEEGSSTDNIVNGAFVNQGIQQITKATGGDGNKLLGFIVGFDSIGLEYLTNGSGINQAGQVRIATVAHDPNQIFEGICTSALTATAANKNANITIGSVNTTMRTDSSSINASVNTTSTFQIKLLGLAPYIGNEWGANQVLRFRINNHCYGNVTAGV